MNIGDNNLFTQISLNISAFSRGGLLLQKRNSNVEILQEKNQPRG